MSFLSNFITSEVLPEIVSVITGLQASHFSQVVEWVKEAESKFTTGDEKKAFVINALENAFNDLLPWMLNFIVESAVAYAKVKGLIPNK